MIGANLRVAMVPRLSHLIGVKQNLVSLITRTVPDNPDKTISRVGVTLSQFDTARALFQLQKIDIRLAKSRYEYRSLKTRLESQAGLEELEVECNAARARMLEDQTEIKRLEGEVVDLKARQEELNKRYGGGGVITTERQFEATELEQQAALRQLQDTEARVVQVTERSEQSGREYQDLSDKLEETREQWTKSEPEIRMQISNVAQEYTELNQERTERVVDIPANDLRYYTALLVKKGPNAVALITQGACQACNVRLPVGEIARMKKETKDLTFCSSCGSILIRE